MDRTIEAAARARESGMQVLIGSTLEGAVGMAASLVAAQVVKPDLASGLSTLDLFEDNFEAFPADGPLGSAPSGIGLGTDPDGTIC
jgi:O-succinylbenzoate synthase